MRYRQENICKTTLRNPWDTKLIIFGTGSNAEMAWDYFRCESEYDIVAFTQDQNKPVTNFKGHMVYSFEGIENIFSPNEYNMFVAIGDCHLRAEIYRKCEEKGYNLVSFVSAHAYIGGNVSIGKNCFIQEFNNLQYGVEIGDNTWLWAKNHIGHHTKIGKHCFLASGITISGYCRIGDYTFVGSGATTRDNIKIGENCLVGLGVRVCQDIPDNKKFVALQTYPDETPTYKDRIGVTNDS